MQRLCEQHGGRYTGQLRMNECTHLIVSEPTGGWGSALPSSRDKEGSFSLACVALRRGLFLGQPSLCDPLKQV